MQSFGLLIFVYISVSQLSPTANQCLPMSVWSQILTIFFFIYYFDNALILGEWICIFLVDSTEMSIYFKYLFFKMLFIYF